MSKSWRTTVAGVLAGLSVVFGQLSAILDGNPDTQVDWTMMATTLGVLFASFGLVVARDNDVTSEKAGAK